MKFKFFLKLAWQPCFILMFTTKLVLLATSFPISTPFV